MLKDRGKELIKSGAPDTRNTLSSEWTGCKTYGF